MTESSQRSHIMPQPKPEAVVRYLGGLSPRASRVPDDFFPHVRPQRFRNHHTAILLLVILHDGDPRPPHCQAAAVQRVGVLRFLAALEADTGAAGLKGFVVGA